MNIREIEIEKKWDEIREMLDWIIMFDDDVYYNFERGVIISKEHGVFYDKDAYYLAICENLRLDRYGMFNANLDELYKEVWNMFREKAKEAIQRDKRGICYVYLYVATDVLNQNYGGVRELIEERGEVIFAYDDDVCLEVYDDGMKKIYEEVVKHGSYFDRFVEFIEKIDVLDEREKKIVEDLAEAYSSNPSRFVTLLQDVFGLEGVCGYQDEQATACVWVTKKENMKNVLEAARALLHETRKIADRLKYFEIIGKYKNFL